MDDLTALLEKYMELHQQHRRDIKNLRFDLELTQRKLLDLLNAWNEEHA